MNNVLKISFIAIMAVSLAACGSASKGDEKAEVAELRKKLEKLKKDRAGLETEIRQVEDKIAKIDPTAQQTSKLISVSNLSLQDFSHYIELQGKVDAKDVAYISPASGPGLVRAIYVQNGSRVSKGQSLLKLDDNSQRQQVNNAQQGVANAKAQLAQAKTLYERRQNLWKEKIGTEIEVINARTNYESAQAAVSSAEASLAIAQDQLNKTTVTAPFSGVIENVNVRVGETFTGQAGNQPQLTIVNNSNLKMTANVPENYISRVKKGDSVLVLISETGKPYRSVISVVGAAVDPTNRSFIAEAKLPSDPLLKPNQLATMKILDYKAKQVVAVPTNIVQSDEKGKYVYVTEKAGDKLVARKRTVVAGETYQGLTEIKSGLTGSEQIITEGYQTVYDGQTVSTGR